MKDKKLISWIKDATDGMKTIVIHKAHNMILAVWRQEDFKNYLVELAYYLGKLDTFERIYEKLKEGEQLCVTTMTL